MLYINLLKEKNLKKYFEAIKNDTKIMMASEKPVTTNKDVFFSRTVQKIDSANGFLFYCKNYGTFCCKTTYEKFAWLIKKMYNNNKYFYLISQDEYEKRFMSYCHNL